jgi:DNA-binding NarL/FixJ family response regulator
MPGVSIVLIDDHPLFSRGLELMLNGGEEVRVVGRSGDATGAVALVDGNPTRSAFGLPEPGRRDTISGVRRRSDQPAAISFPVRSK